MRLVELTANKPSFRRVRFNRTGLSLVLAEEKSANSSETSTYNGVGKSLLLALLHFCLGSNRNKGLELHLPDWTFSLALEIDDAQHVVTRNAGKQSEIQLDGEDIGLRDLCAWLQDATLDLPSGVSHLSFRSILSRFIRSGRGAYVEFTYASQGESKKPYGPMLATAFLLGLDLDLAKAKFDLRTREQELARTMDRLEKDPLFAELLADDSVGIELTALEEQATSLESDLTSFEVAEDYHDIVLEANSIKRSLDRARREIVKLEDAVSQIRKSLEAHTDVSPELVFGLYREAEKALPQLVERHVNDVVAFQRELQDHRRERLTRERQSLQREMAEHERERERLSRQLDEKLGYLKTHRALDEYVAVSKKLSEVNSRIVRLQESKAVRDRVDREQKRLQRDRAEEDIRADEYLEDVASLIEEAAKLFRRFAKELYGARPSGLSIGNDSGNNQLRYRIDAKITADAAEGINEAKIFCFDMVTFSLRRGHRMDFLVHDSSLFSPVDPRQRLAMLRIADRVSRDLGVQYVATLNHHDITSIQKQTTITDAEYEYLFGQESVVLTLTDESAEGKLLGIEVDMDYTN